MAGPKVWSGTSDDDGDTGSQKAAPAEKATSSKTPEKTTASK